MVGLTRSNVVGIHRDCRFWCGACGRPMLIARQGRKTATLTFEQAGMDSKPGRPTVSLDASYERARRKLVSFVGQALRTTVASAA